MRLEGKTAVITGASMGIGRAAAILFAQEGARVFCVDIEDKGGEETVALINQKSGQKAFFIHADVGNADQVRAMARKCQEKTEKVDILFNNAGSLIWQDFDNTTDETWAQMLATNLSSVYLCSKYLLPLMKAAGSASIINNASIDGLLGNPHIVAYCAAKGGVMPFTHVMAHNLAKYKIRVNSICTGGIDTGMVGKVNSLNPELPKRMVALTPLGRRGTAEEVANVALFFASDESSFVNGANLVVDGGRTGITQGMF